MIKAIIIKVMVCKGYKKMHRTILDKGGVL